MSPLRSDGSQDDQAGEAGLLEQSSGEAKSLKTRVKVTVDYNFNEIAVEAASWGASGPSKKGYSHGNLLKKRELDNSSKRNQTRAKGSLPENNTTDKKEQLTLTPGNVAEGR